MSKIQPFKQFIKTAIGAISICFTMLYFVSPQSASTVRRVILFNIGPFSHYVKLTKCIDKSEFDSNAPSALADNEGIFNLTSTTIADIKAKEGSVLAFDFDNRNIYTSLQALADGTNNDVALIGDTFYIGTVEYRDCTGDAHLGKGMFFAKGLFNRR